MLTATGCTARRQALREHFSKHDLVIISSPAHIFYLSGFLTQPTELSAGGLNFLLIDREGQACLIADSPAQSTFVDQLEVWDWYDHHEAALPRHAAAVQELSTILQKQYGRISRVAVEENHLPIAARNLFKTDQIEDLGPTLHRMRRSKYEDELACIRRAIRATEAGHAAARRIIRPGLTELDLYADVQSAITLAAGEPIVMRGGFAGGQRSETIGGPPTSNLLKSGDLMILDLYPLIGGYGADLANTLCVGRSTQAQREHFAALQDAMQAVEVELRPGLTAGQVYAACRTSLAAPGLADFFPHHAGHGLGLDHPEPPYCVPNSQEVLQVGDVVAIEPGAYVSGWGGARIEHNYLITEGGCERLSNHQIGL